MGEIKSTLDLVMEKTRHLTLSEEEKRQHKRKEERKRLAGLLQRYQDGLADIDKTGEELDRLVQTEDGPAESALRDEVMSRLALGGDNARWLELLQSRYRIDPSGWQQIEKDFFLAVDSAAGRRIEEMKGELERLGRISGSAVVPNLEADATWIETRRAIAADFQQLLAAELARWRSDTA